MPLVALIAAALLGTAIYRSRRAKPVSNETAALPTSHTLQALFNGQQIPVSMNGQRPNTGSVPPRYWVTIDTNAPDAHYGSFWRGVLHRQWGNVLEPVIVDLPTIINGTMRARVFTMPTE